MNKPYRELALVPSQTPGDELLVEIRAALEENKGSVKSLDKRASARASVAARRMGSEPRVRNEGDRMKLTAYRRWKEEREEGERQLVLLALAVLSLENPDFDFACNEIAVQFDNVEAGRAVMYDGFRELRAKRAQ